MIVPWQFPRRDPTLPAPSGVGRRAARERTLADLLAPAAVEVTRDALRLERQYARTLVVSGYPRSVGPGWLAPLCNFPEPIEVSMHIAPLESGPVQALLARKLVQLESSRRLADRGGRLADPERETALADAEQLRDALQRGDEKVFAVSLYLLLRAGTPTQLDRLTRRVEAAAAALLAHTRVALYEQDLGFASCLPQAQDRLGRSQQLDTSSVATTFPFTASGVTMERGIFYGVAADSHTPVLIDPFGDALDNANLAIFASSGAGKSYFTKLLLLRGLLRGVEAIVIDPEREYEPLARAVEGQTITLGSHSAQRINPFDLPPGAGAGPDDGDPLAEQSMAVLALLELMLGEPDRPLGTEERAVLERAVRATYATAGIRPGDRASYRRPAPLLRDLHGTLVGEPTPLAASLALRLERYVEGALAGMFAGPTNVALGRPLVVFDLQRLEPELRPIGIHLITSYVWSVVRRQARDRFLVIDEAWSLLQYERGAAFLGSMARRARKYGLGLVTITQDVEDALRHPQGRAVLTNADCRLLLKQSAATIGPVAEACQLSAEERRYLLSAERGQGLLCCHNQRLPLRIAACAREHVLATTNPRELRARGGRLSLLEPPDGLPAEEWLAWPNEEGEASGDDDTVR